MLRRGMGGWREANAKKGDGGGGAFIVKREDGNLSDCDKCC